MPLPDTPAIEAADALRQHARLPAGWNPAVSIVLGSGLGALADSLLARSIPNFPPVDSTLLPGFAPSLVPGHHGRFLAGYLRDVPVLFQQGRIHGYEGHSFQALTASVRLFNALGTQCLVLTNAAGGIHPDFRPGDLMLIQDHLRVPMLFPAFHTTPRETNLLPRLPDTLPTRHETHLVATSPWSPRLRQIAASVPCPLRLHSGVYAMMPGPAYETPAEVRMLRTLGADAVGMSTVPEALEAGALQLPALGISCITNTAAGLQDSPLSHAEVTATGCRIQHHFAEWLDCLIPQLSSLLSKNATTFSSSSPGCLVQHSQTTNTSHPRSSNRF
jgi:purine-nucleoside phosphorylase